MTDRAGVPDVAVTVSTTRQLLMDGSPQYDPAAVEQLFSLRQWRQPAILWRAFRRFFRLLSFFLRVVFYAWADGQLWLYLGADDLERAQSQRRRRHAEWVTERLLEFGPTFIKVGQSLSTRVDLFRKEVIESLAGLQDRVPPFPSPQARQIIEDALGQPPEAIFDWFNDQPLAAASLGQVHRARLHDGREIILKVQRPHLMETVTLDLAIVRKLARFLEANTELGRGRNWVGIVDEFGHTLFEEMDYIREGRNADAFRRNFRRQRPDPLIEVTVPEIIWPYTSRRVLAMEYAPGVKINDLRALEQAGFDRERLADVAVKAYFQQILVDGFYHADPHPGNLAVRPDGSIVFYDFGMVGRLPDPLRRGIVDTFLNIINKKPDNILNNLIELNMLAPNADLEIIRQVIVWALDHYYDVPHDALNFEQITDDMAELIYAHPFKLPANFTFMVRALITLEGVATSLNPQIQFLGIAVDYAQQFLGKTLNPAFVVKKGLDFLGLSPETVFGGSRRPPQRVRLQHDEWVPLARYVKLGFCLLGLGQVVLFALMLGVLLMVISTAPVSMPTLWLAVLVGAVVLVGLGLLALLVLFPARRRPLVFQPMETRRRSGG